MIVDACGGSADFLGAVDQELAKMFPGAKSAVLPPDNAVYQTGAVKIGEVAYRPFAQRVVGKMRAPRVKGLDVGGRTAVYVSAEDLSTGLVGMSIDGIYGYSPDSSTNLMRTLVSVAAGVAAAPATKPAATQPAAEPKGAMPEKKEHKPDEKHKPMVKKGDGDKPKVDGEKPKEKKVE